MRIDAQYGLKAPSAEPSVKRLCQKPKPRCHLVVDSKRLNQAQVNILGCEWAQRLSWSGCEYFTVILCLISPSINRHKFHTATLWVQ